MLIFTVCLLRLCLCNICRGSHSHWLLALWLDAITLLLLHAPALSCCLVSCHDVVCQPGVRAEGLPCSRQVHAIFPLYSRCQLQRHAQVSLVAAGISIAGPVGRAWWRSARHLLRHTCRPPLLAHQVQMRASSCRCLWHCFTPREGGEDGAAATPRCPRQQCDAPASRQAAVQEASP